MSRRTHNLPMHQHFLSSFSFSCISNGITRMRPFITVPAELREPYIVFGVNLCELAAGKVYFAVIAEAVDVNWQVVFRPAVRVDMFRIYKADLSAIRVAEAATYIIIFDDRPASLAGAAVEGGRILYTVQNTSQQTRKVAAATYSFLRPLLHRELFSTTVVDAKHPP